MRRALSFFATLLCGASALADPPAAWKAQNLSSSEERRWIEKVSNHRTRDGVTVMDTLKFAEQMRPRSFKFGRMQVVYNGASGEPDGVVVDYFIGLKRADADAFSMLFSIERKGSDISLVFPRNEFGYQTPAEAVEAGRDNLLRMIDDDYDTWCIEHPSLRRLC